MWIEFCETQKEEYVLIMVEVSAETKSCRIRQRAEAVFPSYGDCNGSAGWADNWSCKMLIKSFHGSTIKWYVKKVNHPGFRNWCTRQGVLLVLRCLSRLVAVAIKQGRLPWDKWSLTQSLAEKVSFAPKQGNPSLSAAGWVDHTTPQYVVQSLNIRSFLLILPSL